MIKSLGSGEEAERPSVYCELITGQSGIMLDIYLSCLNLSTTNEETVDNHKLKADKAWLFFWAALVSDRETLL